MTATDNSTLRALLDAVLANPADDLPRLVYADALEEAGDGERAEFIRRQVTEGGTKVERMMYMIPEPVSYSAIPPSLAVHNTLARYYETDEYWRRGVVAEVRCALDVWVGSPCDSQICSSGRVTYRNRRNRDCTLCHGTGRVGSVGRRIVAEHPVER